MGQRSMQNQLYSICGAPSPPELGPVCYALTPDMFEVGNLRGVCLSLTLLRPKFWWQG